jgi:hypothetical protein
MAPRFIGGAKLGIRRLLENLNPSGRDSEELDSALRVGTLHPTLPSVAGVHKVPRLEGECVLH